LEATSKAIVRIGAVGQAAVMKVVTNMIAAVSTQTLAEALAIVRKSGLKPQTLEAALEHNACRSGTIGMKLPKMLSGDYDPHFSLKHMFKDVQLGIHMANALEVEIPATTVTAGVMYGALNHGWGELDFSAIFKVYEPLLAKMPAVLEEPGAPASGELPQQHGTKEGASKDPGCTEERPRAGRPQQPTSLLSRRGGEQGRRRFARGVKAVPKDAKPTSEAAPEPGVPQQEGGSSKAATGESGGSPLNRLRRFFSPDQK
jgi:hypothetical protein